MNMVRAIETRLVSGVGKMECRQKVGGCVFFPIPYPGMHTVDDPLYFKH